MSDDREGGLYFLGLVRTADHSVDPSHGELGFEVPMDGLNDHVKVVRTTQPSVIDYLCVPSQTKAVTDSAARYL